MLIWCLLLLVSSCTTSTQPPATAGNGVRLLTYGSSFVSLDTQLDSNYHITQFDTVYDTVIAVNQTIGGRSGATVYSERYGKSSSRSLRYIIQEPNGDVSLWSNGSSRQYSWLTATFASHSPIPDSYLDTVYANSGDVVHLHDHYWFANDSTFQIYGKNISEQIIKFKEEETGTHVRTNTGSVAYAPSIGFFVRIDNFAINRDSPNWGENIVLISYNLK